MSDKTQELQALAEQIRQLGIAPDTPVRSLPDHVQQMLADYLNQGTLEYSAASYGDAELQSAWDQVTPLINTANTKTAVDKAQKTGVITPGDKAVLDKAGVDTTNSGVLVTSTGTPRWILEQLNGDPTPEQQRRITDEWNTIFGTKVTWDQLVTMPQFSDPTDTVTKVVQAAVLDTTPIVSYSVTLPGNRQVQISGDQMKNQFGLFGFKDDELSRIIRWADAFDFKDATGGVAWQPLASLLKAKGIDTSKSYVDNSAQFIDPETGKVKHSPANGAGGRGRSILDRAAAAPDDKRAAASQFSVAMVSQAYKQALKRYGDPTMAYLGSLDQGLADRLLASGGDITKVSDQDALLAEQYMLNGQWSSDSMHSLGYAGGSGLDSFFQRLKGATPTAAAVRTRPDPDSLKQAAKDLWRNWFRSEPSEDWLDKTAGELMATYMSSPDDQSVDITAKLRAMAEASPEYKSLYGNKQPGQTEGDYQQQFLAASSSILGNEAPDNGAVLSGMKTGQYQTTVGATAASARAMQNSTFLGRLAAAAQIVNEKT